MGTEEVLISIVLLGGALLLGLVVWLVLSMLTGAVMRRVGRYAEQRWHTFKRTGGAESTRPVRHRFDQAFPVSRRPTRDGRTGPTSV